MLYKKAALHGTQRSLKIRQIRKITKCINKITKNIIRLTFTTQIKFIKSLEVSNGSKLLPDNNGVGQDYLLSS